MNRKAKGPLLICERCLRCSCVEVVSRTDDCTIYRISDSDGEVVMTSYSVFPGVDIIYNNVHMSECSVDCHPDGNIIEINHCREGRFECEFKDDFVYLGQGDMSLHMQSEVAQCSNFPFGNYYGISITINPEKASACLSCILEGVDVDLNRIIDKFCTASGCFVLRSKPCLEHIFSELYSVPDSIKYGYFKIKVLEILLFLNAVEVDSDKERSRHIQKSQVELVKSVGKHLTEHLDEHITISRLSAIFGVSETLLKTCFKKVYGVSVYSFIRSHKIQSAALMLKNTDKSVLSIAGSMGYENGSKFAKAFKDVIGITPREYRNQNV